MPGWRSGPQVKILFLPYRSAILPSGRREMAAAKMNEAATQLNEIAFIENSLPKEGSAMLIEEPIYGTRKEAMVVTSRATLLFAVSFTLFT